jgi:tellurite resistance protein
MVTLGVTGPIAQMALPLFVAANVFILVLVVRTIILLMNGRLLPAAPSSPSAVGSIR